MPDAYLIKPDREFAQELIDMGGDSLKQCFQCATCSVTCNISPEQRPFPRKEMIWAQWGLKDKLLGDPDVWLCHRCTDCSVHCPRGASPGDVLSAVRDYSIKHYAFPGFMGKAMGKPALLPLLLAIPAVLLLAVLAGIGHLHIPAGEVEYGHFLPHTPLQMFFTSFLAFAVLASVIGAVRFWKNMDRFTPFKGKSTSLVASVISFAKDFLTHSKFKDCEQSKSRLFSHLFTFYGFVGLLITTTLAVVYAYIIKYYPLPLFHWVKILGNVSTLFIVIGLVWIISDRINERGGNEKTTRYDWTFIGILFATVLTGIATEFLRYANVPPVAYPVYFIHLVFVFALLIYLPYSHFAHLIYRSVAMVYARYSGREDKV